MRRVLLALLVESTQQVEGYDREVVIACVSSIPGS
jgi:hypothetical protein